MFIFSLPQQAMMRRILGMVCFCLFILSFAYLADEEYDVKTSLGWAALFVTIVMYGSPLSTLREVIRTESSETLSLPLTLSTLVVTGTWTYYGHLIQDSFVKVRAVLIFSGMQVFLQWQEFLQNKKLLRPLHAK